MKLDGSELLVLQACRDLHKDQYGNVHDDEIARATFLPQPDVRGRAGEPGGRGLVSRFDCPTTTMPLRSRPRASLS